MNCLPRHYERACLKRIPESALDQGKTSKQRHQATLPENRARRAHAMTSANKE